LREDDKDPSCLRYRSKADPEKTQSTQAEGVRESDKKPEKNPTKNQKKTIKKKKIPYSWDFFHETLQKCHYKK